MVYEEQLSGNYFLGWHVCRKKLAKLLNSNRKVKRKVACKKKTKRPQKIFEPRSAAKALFGNGPNTVSGSTVSNTELSEFFWAHWVPGSELSEFLSAYDLCAQVNSPSFSQNSPSLPYTQWGSVSSLVPKQCSARFLIVHRPVFTVLHPRFHTEFQTFFWRNENDVLGLNFAIAHTSVTEL